MASFSLFSYSRYWFMRQSGIRSAIRTTSKTWTHPLVCITAPTSNSGISRRQIWARDYASKKGPDKNRGKKALDDFLEEFDDDEDEEAFKRGSEVAGGKETAVAKFVRECQSGKGKARGKKESKGGGKKGSAMSRSSIVTYEEAREVLDVDAYWADLEECVSNLKEDFVKHLTLRSGTALDDLPVELEGDKFPLREVATISKKDPKRVVIECSSFPQAAKSVASAIANAGMNLNPQQEGTRIYVPIPKVTKEYRERLAKGARDKCVAAREGMRKMQAKQISRLGDLELKSGSVNKDHLHAVKEIVMAMTKHFEADADVIMLKKQNELMGK